MKPTMQPLTVEPAPAATVVLLRDAPGGLEAYLQRRPSKLGFAAGLWVFPGGRVDEADTSPELDQVWRGPSAGDWAAALGLPVDEARGLVAAACRETFEEAGVLLAEPNLPAADLATLRRRLLGGARFADLLMEAGLGIDTGLLRYWGWWVTPAPEPRRFDARVFLAALPPDTRVAAHAPEAVEERWIGVRHSELATLPMLPPTRTSLADLSGAATVADALALAEGRRVERIEPELVDGVLILPWGECVPVPVPPPQ